MTRSDKNDDQNRDVTNPSPANPSFESFPIGEENTGSTIDSEDPAPDPGNYCDPRVSEDTGGWGRK